jgi:hypothetical protein
MATRSCVRLSFKRFSLMLYRHWDGYPAEAGAAIVEALKGCNPSDGEYALADVANALLLNTKTSEGKPLYEITGNWHGDLEYAYSVTLDRACTAFEVGIAHYQHHMKGVDGVEREDPGTWQWQYMAPAEFVTLVNKEREQINSRLKAAGHTAQVPMLTA